VQFLASFPDAGSHRSRTQSDVVAEARALIADGVKELNLNFAGFDLLRP